MDNNVSKAEIRETAEALGILNQFPPNERIAIQYYLKGRLDAMAGNIDIPMNRAAAQERAS